MPAGDLFEPGHAAQGGGFPQPEGPTNTTNSLSAMSRLNPLTALKPFGYVFSTSFNITRAMLLARFLLPPKNLAGTLT